MMLVRTLGLVVNAEEITSFSLVDSPWGAQLVADGRTVEPTAIGESARVLGNDGRLILKLVREDSPKDDRRWLLTFGPTFEVPTQ